MPVVASLLDPELVRETLEALRSAGVSASATCGDVSDGLVLGRLPATNVISIEREDDLAKAKAVLAELGIAMAAMETCARCGYDLRGHNDGARCPECGAAIAVAVPDLFCPTCGERVPGNFGVCWSCGRSMDEAPPIVPDDAVQGRAAGAGAGAFDGARRQRFSTIAHADHLFMSPLAEEKVDRVLACVRLAPGERVVDIGCGNGEMLIRLVEASAAAASSEAGSASGLGIDRSEPAIETARRRAAERRSPVAKTRIDWRVGEASGLVSGDSAVDRAFDAALCVGATGALGGFHAALRVLRRIVRPGGCVVVGEGYWRRPPHADYLAALGATADEMTSHAGNVEAAIASGFTPVYSAASSEDEWDHYEGLYLHAMERWLAEHPADPDHAAFKSRMHRWRDAYLRWGRSTLGFGVYVLRNADPA